MGFHRPATSSGVAMLTTLPVRQLGTSDMEITRVGFGAWATGGGGWAYGWGPQDDDESVAAINHALKRGVNWIDTAAVYGLGHSEQVVGKVLKSLSSSDRPYVFTKCGLVWDEKEPMKDAVRSLAPNSIRRECEASLRRLGIERIDLYQFHRPDNFGVPVEESWRTMELLLEEGKVRAIGVSNFDLSLLRKCEAIRHVDSLQPPFSLIKRAAAQHQRVGRRRGVDSYLAWSYRSDRGREIAIAGRWVDRCGDAHSDLRR